MQSPKWIYAALFFSTALFLTNADVVILKDGKTITGRVLQHDGDGVLVQMDYGTFRYPAALVKDVKKETANGPTVEAKRIPSWSAAISALSTNAWAHDLIQVPATVVTEGVLKNVPYISFRCNTAGYELNIYGDLDNPAGVEIGAINYLAKNGEAKSNCIKFVASILTPADSSTVGELSVSSKDTLKRNRLTIETTLPDEPDAYGGWWVSVYDESLLAKARATGDELLAITQPRIEPKPRPTPPVSPQPTQPPTIAATPYSWSAMDLSNARSGPNYAPSTGGSVYVRGYYRKNGTYVSGHSRSR